MKIKRYFPPKRQVYSLLKMLFLQITVSENGYSTKMTSFDDYLTKANQLEQKLLIEIKTSSQDSKKIMAHFLNKYAKPIKHQIHSLDYHLIDKVKKNESVMTGMILMGVNGIITDYLTTSQGENQR